MINTQVNVTSFTLLTISVMLTAIYRAVDYYKKQKQIDLLRTDFKGVP